MRKMDFNAMDNRKCTICGFVFDQDCDDCPAMPSQIRSLHHPTKRTQGVAHKGVRRMTDKTAIEKICSLKRNAENDMPEYDYGWDAALDKAIEALAALEAEKPVENALNLVYQWRLDYKRDPELESMSELSSRIQHFAESYHAEQCKKCFKSGLKPYIAVNDLYDDEYLRRESELA
jgi:hypothetical protein